MVTKRQIEKKHFMGMALKKIGVNQDRTCALSWQWPLNLYVAKFLRQGDHHSLANYGGFQGILLLSNTKKSWEKLQLDYDKTYVTNTKSLIRFD